jgi:hypothetical protein
MLRLTGKEEFAGQKLPTGQFTFVAGRGGRKEGVREKRKERRRSKK